MSCARARARAKQERGERSTTTANDEKKKELMRLQLKTKRNKNLFQHKTHVTFNMNNNKMGTITTRKTNNAGNGNEAFVPATLDAIHMARALACSLTDHRTRDGFLCHSLVCRSPTQDDIKFRFY